jgi:hypothetical protein
MCTGVNPASPFGKRPQNVFMVWHELRGVPGISTKYRGDSICSRIAIFTNLEKKVVIFTAIRKRTEKKLKDNNSIVFFVCPDCKVHND